MSKDLNYYMNLGYKLEIYPLPSAEGKGYVAKLPELDIAIDGETIEKVTRELEIAQKLWFQSALEGAVPIPEPNDYERYSGKFNVRVPKWLHKALSEGAKQEETSLNMYIVSLLSQHHKSV